MASEFHVLERRKRVNVFRVGTVWVFKHFFEDKAIYEALLSHYKKDSYCFEFKSTGEMNKALKLLESSGIDYRIVEDLKEYLVWLDKSSKYAPVLKNSVAYKEMPCERIFLMKDLAAVEEAVSLGAKIYEGEAMF